MNMWAGYPEFLDFLAEDFKDFLANVEEGDLKSEYLLPNIVDKLLKEERANVKVLETQSQRKKEKRLFDYARRLLLCNRNKQCQDDSSSVDRTSKRGGELSTIEVLYQVFAKHFAGVRYCGIIKILERKLHFFVKMATINIAFRHV